MGYPHARWVCPGSIGYSCDPATGAIGYGAPLLYEPEPDSPPCVVQPKAVEVVTAFFFRFRFFAASVSFSYVASCGEDNRHDYACVQ